ncbi:RNA-directed DNA polymerase, eukaryota, reverse transcriptase zinc-binding domain protein [Tanacetum coccineum]|uniref:RNA-directed DNA polymerase, eukaryota, reverse transcriptase zinc-binding domain protein n=1 Tax=Tanacetum coccineum TaxID=301880 RepID=A0ABQ5CUV0_9ASTR
MTKGFLSPKERGRGTGVKEKQITADDSAKAYNYVNEVNTVNDVMDSGSGTTNVTSTLESLGNTFSKESDGLNLSPTVRNEADLAVPLESIRATSKWLMFSSEDGLDAMLEKGPCFIRNNLLILKKWNPNVNLLKEDVGNVPVCAKLHGVPMTEFSEDRLSVIATILGTPLMLDSYMSVMCMQS